MITIICLYLYYYIKANSYPGWSRRSGQLVFQNVGAPWFDKEVAVINHVLILQYHHMIILYVLSINLIVTSVL